mgnify:CR=1 FL=1
MKESLNFENRSVVVTGGTKGIGAAIVKKLLHYVLTSSSQMWMKAVKRRQINIGKKV